MKVLVTGALGFIGSNLTERLVAEGHDVTALDNMHTGSDSNLESVKDKVKIVKKNSGEIASLGEKFDAIFHQGIYSSSPMYKDDPRLMATVLDEWLSVLDYARKNGSSIVYASSSSLYNGKTPPHREDMELLAMDFYSEGRYSMERLAKVYSEFYGVNSVGLRYFSVYGPHERSKGKYANLVTQFLWEMKEGKSPLIFGDGSQTRDFISVGDVVDANMLAIAHKENSVFNVGTGKNVSLNEVVRLLNQELGTSIEATYKENPIKNYVKHTQADTTKARENLGFTAKTTLEEGVKRLIGQYAG